MGPIVPAVHNRQQLGDFLRRRREELSPGDVGCRPVAHSMSGVVAAAAAELAPELFAHLVYVTAFAPVVGMPAR